MASSALAGAGATRTNLLSLPTELLLRVDDYLAPEQLLSLRKVHRHLAAIFVDRLARHYFRELHCCMFDRKRWDALREILSRNELSAHVEYVRFTVDILEQHSKDDIESAAQNSAAESLLSSETERLRDDDLVDEDLIQDVFEQLHQLQHQDTHCTVNVDIDFARGYGTQLEELGNHEGVFIGLADRMMKLDSLGIGPESTIGVDQWLTGTRRERLLANTSSVKHLTYRTLADEDYNPDGKTMSDHKALALASDIVASSDQLQTLSLFLDWSFAHSEPYKLSKKLLLANSLAHLQVLKMNDVRLTRETLLCCLSNSSPTLKRLKMEIIILSDNDETWEAALRLISRMPSIEDLELCRLSRLDEEYGIHTMIFQYSGSEPHDNFSTKYGKGMVRQGIESNLAAGLDREWALNEYE